MKKLCVYLCCITLMLLMSINSFAYKQGPGVRVISKKDCLPEGTVYIDLLIPTKKTYDKPICNKLITLDRSEIILSEESEIVNYNEAGFISFSVYLSDNISYGYLDDEPFYIDFGQDNDLDIKKEYENFKVACLDKNGDILKVSNMASAKSYGYGNFIEFDYFFLSEKGIKPKYVLNPFETVGIVALMGLLVFSILLIVKKNDSKKEEKHVL